MLIGLLVLVAVATDNVLRSFGNALDLADGESGASLPWFVLTALVVSSPLIAFVWTLYFWLRSVTCHAAVHALGILKHPDGLPAVAAALNHGRLAEAAAGALHRLTEVIGPEHYGRFGLSLESDLVYMLYAVDESTSVDIVKILGHVGGARSLSALERIAEYGYTARKRATAQQVLPALRERIDRDREAERLLRPSFAADDTLLRPAVASGNDDTDHLLRPAASGDGC